MSWYHTFSLFFALVSSLPIFATTPQYKLIKEKSKLEFIAYTNIFTVPGTFSDWEITSQTTGPNLTDVKVVVKVKTASLNTDNTSRDDHLKTEEFFWVEKYPTAEFESKKITEKSEGIFTVEGELRMLATVKPLQFDVKLEKNFENQEGIYRLTGAIKVNRKEVGLTYNKTGLFKTIWDDVDIKFELFAIKGQSLEPLRQEPQVPKAKD